MWELAGIVGGFVGISAVVIALARRSTAQWERETRLARRRRRPRDRVPTGGVAGARPADVPVRAGAARTVAGRVVAGRALAGRVMAGRVRRHVEGQPPRARRVARRRHRTRPSDEAAGPGS
jgi:hypothetical protein